ncbi:MAG: SMR family transporter [Pirellulaceae bacterium]
MSVNWIMLIIGGLFETGFAISLGKAQYATGKYMWLWLSVFVLCVSISMYLLFRAMGGEKAIAVGTAYAVWGAIGATYCHCRSFVVQRACDLLAYVLSL